MPLNHLSAATSFDQVVSWLHCFLSAQPPMLALLSPNALLLENMNCIQLTPLNCRYFIFHSWYTQHELLLEHKQFKYTIYIQLEGRPLA